MSQARKKGPLNQNCGKGCNHVDGRSHGRTISCAWPGHSLKDVRVLKGVASGGKQKGREHIKRWIHNGWKTKNRLGNSLGTNMKVMSKKVKAEVLEKLREESNRKLYPLRRRSSSSKDDTLSCHVLLTRLKKNALQEDSNLHKEDPNIIPKRTWHKNIKRSQQKLRKTKEALYLPSKSKQKTTTIKTLTQEPRKRRLASLNAEAVNSLLLDKTDSPHGSKLAKKQHHASTAPFAIITKDETNSTKSLSQGRKTAVYQRRKKANKSKAEKVYVKEPSFYSITPRRLAGLNAAALLKLTSATAASKRRIKTDSQGVCTARNPTACSKSRVKQPMEQDFKQTLPWRGSAECKSSRNESKLHWEGSANCRCLSKQRYQAHSMMGYPLKVVKNEQVEAGLCPCFCCSTEGSVEYCHRLALFLGQKAYSETDEHPVTSVKHECLATSSSLSHPGLTLSTHPCLCADPCYSSFYVHVAHHGPRSVSLGAQALSCPHNSTCPSNVPGSKLLSSSDSHVSGISSSVFCPSVRSPCYSDGCRVGSYTFSAVQPVTSSVCSYKTGCPSCNHKIKTESYPSPQGDHSSPLLVPPALPLSGSPLPMLSPSSPVLPRLVSTLTGNKETDVRLQGARKCPQNTKPTNGSIGMGPSKLSQKQPMSSSASAKQQKNVSHPRTTNGWHPFGESTEKEVYIAGQDETAVRQCYEGVQRDGEVIRVRDTVLLRSGSRKKSLPYVAKISALWNDPKTGELMMSLFWYYRPEHTQGGRDPSTHCENEIFASRHQDENSVACIEDRCYVLPLAQYCRFCALVKRRSEGVPNTIPMVPRPSDSAVPSHRLVPEDVDPDMVYLCRHVYDFRYGRILKNPQ